jgi:hypothetical protein
MRIEVNHYGPDASGSVFKNIEPVKLTSDRISPVVNIKNRPNDGLFVRANDLFITYPTSKNGQIRTINQKDASNVVLKAHGVDSPFTALQMEKLDSVCLIVGAVDLKLFIWQISNDSLQAVSPLVIDVPGEKDTKIHAVAFKPRGRTAALSVSKDGSDEAEIFVYNLEFEPQIESRFWCPEPIINLQYSSHESPSLWLVGVSRVFVEKNGEAVSGFKVGDKARDHSEARTQSESQSQTKPQNSSSLLFAGNGDMTLLRSPVEYYRSNGECTTRINLRTDINGATSFENYGIIWQQGNIFILSIDQGSRCIRQASLLSADLEILDVAATKNLESRPDIAFDLYLYHSSGIGIISVAKADLNAHPLDISALAASVSLSTDQSLFPAESSKTPNKKSQKLQATKADKSHTLIDPEYSRELTDTRVKHSADIDIAKMEEAIIKSGKFVSRKLFDATKKSLLDRIELLDKKVAYLLAATEASKREEQTGSPNIPPKGKSLRADTTGSPNTSSKERLEGHTPELSKPKPKEKSPDKWQSNNNRKSSSRGTTPSRQETPVPEDIPGFLDERIDDMETPQAVLTESIIEPKVESVAMPENSQPVSQLSSAMPSIPSSPLPSSQEFEARIVELTESAQDQERLNDLLTEFSSSFDYRRGVPLDPGVVHNQLIILSAVACISRGILNVDVKETIESLVNWLISLLKVLQPKLVGFQQNRFLNRVLREVMVNLEISDSREVIPVISILQDILSTKVI